MGIRKKPYMTTLEADGPNSDGAWVESLVPVFGDVATVLRLCVLIVRGCIAARIIEWDIPALQALVGKSVKAEPLRLDQPGLPFAEREWDEGQPRRRLDRVIAQMRAAAQAIASEVVTGRNLFRERAS